MADDSYTNNQAIIHEEFMDVVGASADEWRASDSATVSSEATFVRNYDGSKASLRITSTNAGTSGTAIMNMSSTHDFSNTEMIISYYIDPSEIATVAALVVSIHASTGSGDVITMGFADPTSSGRASVSGWQERRIPLCDSSFNADTAANLLTINQIRIKLQSVLAADTPWVIIDDIRFVTQRPKSAIVLSYDDNKSEDLVVAQYLASVGLKATFFINPDNVDQATYLTLAEVKQIESMGHLIANHSWDHTNIAVSDTGFSAAAELINEAYRWMLDNGFETGARIWAIPGGSLEYYNWTRGREDLLAYVDICRVTTPPSGGLSTAVTTYDGSIVVETAKFTDTDAAIDDADVKFHANYRLGGGIFVEGCHASSADVVTGGAVTANYKAHLDTLAALVVSGEIDNLTFDELPLLAEAISNDGYRARYN